MLEAAGGGGGTPWESMTLDKMQSLIQNPDTDKQWDLVDGWKKSAELLLEHRFQVQGYRDNLASAWPPEKSTASAAYLARLDALISNLSETYEASLANYTAISSATGSIYQAQVQMEKIYQEYKNNETALTTYNTKLAQQNSSSTPTPSPSPSPSGDEPPVAPGRQEELRVQAVTLLSGVSTDLAQAQVSIVKPAPYVGKYYDDGTDPIGTGGYVPPPIPPITPISSSESTTSKSTRSPTATFPTSTGNVVQPPPSQTVIGGQQPGLVLGGTTVQPTVPPSTTGLSPITSTLPGGSPAGSPGLLPPSSTFLPGGGSSGLPTNPTGTGRPARLPRESLLRPGARLPEGMRAMPAGGVIGGTPGVGIGQPTSGRAGARRVNPVGGVIGEGEGSLGSRRGSSVGGISAAERSGGLYGQGGASRRSGRNGEADGSHWDPDNPWETTEGVSPVVLPPQEQRIDPGPAIGLS